MKQKFVMISMDAMIFEDLNYLLTRPSFKWLMEQGSMVKRLKSIYPTLTYPCHATMVTGNFPRRHGIINNTEMCPGNVNPPWVVFHKDYCCRDLFDACKEAGLTTAAVAWPTTGLHSNIDYLMDEVAGIKLTTEEEYHQSYLQTGTSEDVWRNTMLPHLHFRTKTQGHPGIALFSTNVFCDIIRTYKPDFSALHIANIDTYRHKTGVFSDLVQRGLEESDRMLGMILQALKDSRELDNTNIVVTSDHGQIDVRQIVRPNVLLAKHGYITVDKDGTVTDWRAWCLQAGSCAEIFVRDPADEAEIFKLLQTKAEEEKWGFSRVYTRQETAEYGFDGPFSFVLETDGQSTFMSDWVEPYFTKLPAVKGSHGFHPDKGPRPPLLVRGPGFQSGVIMEHAHLVDGAPTWAKLLGVSLPDTDGSPLESLLKR